MSKIVKAMIAYGSIKKTMIKYSVNPKEFNFHIDEDIQVKEVKIEERLFKDESTKKGLAEIIFHPGQDVFFFCRSLNIDFENALQRRRGFWNRDYMSWALASDENPIEVRVEGSEKFYYGIARLSEETLIKSIDHVRYHSDSVIVITPKSDDTKSTVFNLLAKHLDSKRGESLFYTKLLNDDKIMSFCTIVSAYGAFDDPEIFLDFFTRKDFEI